MTTIHWQTIREQTIDALDGETPGPEIETGIIDVFEIAPQTVIRALADVADAKRHGQIVSGWAVAHARLTRNSSAPRDVQVDADTGRARRVANAEAWIRRVGCQYDDQQTVEGELFGDDFGAGMLEPWADDQVLRQRLVGLWREHRPTGEAVETEAIERAEEWKRSHACQHCGKTKPFLLAACPWCRHAPSPPKKPEPEPEPALAAPQPEELPY